MKKYGCKIYCGFLNENDNVVKIGRTVKTCYARCKNTDYTIHQAAFFFEIEYDVYIAIENELRKMYKKLYNLYDGNEYFMTKCQHM